MDLRARQVQHQPLRGLLDPPEQTELMDLPDLQEQTEPTGLRDLRVPHPPLLDPRALQVPLEVVVA